MLSRCVAYKALTRAVHDTVIRDSIAWEEDIPLALWILYQTENTANNRTRGNHNIRGNRMGGIRCQRKKSTWRVTTLKPIHEIKNQGQVVTKGIFLSKKPESWTSWCAQSAIIFFWALGNVVTSPKPHCWYDGAICQLPLPCNSVG